MIIEEVYVALWKLGNYRVGGILLCRLLAPVALVVLLWLSRLVQNLMIKILSIVVAMLLYFFPSVVNLFAE